MLSNSSLNMVAHNLYSVAGKLLEIHVEMDYFVGTEMILIRKRFRITQLIKTIGALIPIYVG